MGTETMFWTDIDCSTACTRVKLNDPLMGTETPYCTPFNKNYGHT